MDVQSFMLNLEQQTNNSVLPAIFELPEIALESISGGVGEVSPY